MMQFPLIVRATGRISAGSTSDILVSNYDFLPTVLTYLGLADHIPKQPQLPGRDFSAILDGRTVAWDNVVFYEMETCRAIRENEWKYVGPSSRWA